MNSKTISLENGEVTVMDCGKVQIHVYNTKDAIDDQVIILERPNLIGKGGKAVVIELPCFKNSIDEVTRYIRDSGLKVEGKLVAYHAAGDTFLPDVRSYMTESAHKYNTVINPDSDAYEVEIPEAKAVYMHMLGHDCHSIVAGAGHADAIIANLKGYLDRGFQIFLSAHYGPETREDVQTKIDYLEMLKEVASGCSNAEEFKAAVNERCPGYSGANYLDMTAGFFFPSQ